MSINKIILALPLSLSLCGCVIVAGDGEWEDDNLSSSWEAEQNKNRSNITTLDLGMVRGQVLSQMGEPTFTEAFKSEDGTAYQVLYYRTHRKHGDGETTKDETTALVFENDSLIGWGNDALTRIKRTR